MHAYMRIKPAQKTEISVSICSEIESIFSQPKIQFQKTKLYKIIEFYAKHTKLILQLLQLAHSFAHFSILW